MQCSYQSSLKDINLKQCIFKNNTYNYIAVALLKFLETVESTIVLTTGFDLQGTNPDFGMALKFLHWKGISAFEFIIGFLN